MNTTVREVLVSALEGLAICGLLAIAAVASSFRLGEVLRGGDIGADADRAAIEQLGAFRLVVPTIRYGLEVERFAAFEEADVARATRLVDGLRAAGLSRGLANDLAQAAVLARENLRELAPHKRVTVVGADGAPAYVIVELGELWAGRRPESYERPRRLR